MNGHSVLRITEKGAPSFFKKYYAKNEFTTYCDEAPFFRRSFNCCLEDFLNKISEINEIIEEIDVLIKVRHNLYILLLISAVSALDNFICSLILFAAVRDRNLFLKTATRFCNNNIIISRITKMWCDNTIDSAEQEVMDKVLKTSFSNIDRINEELKKIYDIEKFDEPQIDKIFTLRHVIVHRIGIKKDGKKIELDKATLYEYLDTINSFVLKINDQIKNSKILIKLNEE